MSRTVLLLVALGLTLALALDSQASEFYQWTASDDVVSFTDDAKEIPKAYRDQAVKRTTKELAESTETRFTPHSTSKHGEELAANLKRLGAVNSPSVVNPNRLNDCTGHVLVTSQRIQDGEYNRRIFVVTDECGRTRSVTSFYPDVQINR